jgi:uncharacterized RDD family membrane protein YckC
MSRPMTATFDTQRVTTADNVGIGYRVAGLATRTTAAAVDLLIVAILLILGLLLVSAIATAVAGAAADPLQSFGLATLLLVALEFFLFVGYFTIAEAVTGGRTPGKSALGIRVIRVEGGTPTLGDCFLRNLAYLADVGLGVGPLLMFFHPQGRRLGDLLAGTIVVRDRIALTLAAATAVPPVFLRSPDPGLEINGLGRLGEREFAALRTFLSRPGLLPEQRARIASELAAKLQARMGLSPTAPERTWPAELFVERLYLQLASRRSR